MTRPPRAKHSTMLSDSIRKIGDSRVDVGFWPILLKNSFPVQSDSLRPGMLHQALPNTRAVLSKGEVIVA